MGWLYLNCIFNIAIYTFAIIHVQDKVNMYDFDASSPLQKKTNIFKRQKLAFYYNSWLFDRLTDAPSWSPFLPTTFKQELATCIYVKKMPTSYHFVFLS